MFRLRRPDLVELYHLDEKDKLIHMSVMDVGEEEKRVKSDEVIVITLITIFVLLFFATSLKVFITLLISGLIIGIFGLIKNYKERRR